MNEEIWKDVIGFEGLYKISSMGNVKSLNYARSGKEGNLKKSDAGKGYEAVSLSRDNNPLTKRVHQLVAESFLGHKRCGMKLVVDHIDFNRKNNKVENLEIITNRENTSKRRLRPTSLYIGVHWSKANKKWSSRIYTSGNQMHLGFYDNEIDAHKAYQQKLKEITND